MKYSYVITNLLFLSFSNPCNINVSKSRRESVSLLMQEALIRCQVEKWNRFLQWFFELGKPFTINLLEFR